MREAAALLTATRRNSHYGDAGRSQTGRDRAKTPSHALIFFTGGASTPAATTLLHRSLEFVRLEASQPIDAVPKPRCTQAGCHFDGLCR